MIHEFSRSELLLGKDSMEKLAGSCVAVFGVGGVGSHCIEALARGGVGRLVLIDNDTVSITNINRQSIAYHSTVGMYKTQVMKTRILDMNPQAEVFAFETFVLPDNIENLFEQIPCKVNYIIDAIDTVTAKLALAQYAIDHEIPFIASMGTGNKLHPELFEITDLSKTGHHFSESPVLQGRTAEAAGNQHRSHLEARRARQRLFRSPSRGSPHRRGSDTRADREELDAGQ